MNRQEASSDRGEGSGALPHSRGLYRGRQNIAHLSSRGKDGFHFLGIDEDGVDALTVEKWPRFE